MTGSCLGQRAGGCAVCCEPTGRRCGGKEAGRKADHAADGRKSRSTESESLMKSPK